MYDDEVGNLASDKDAEQNVRKQQLEELKKKQEEFNKIKAMHDLLEEEDREYKKKEEEQQKSLGLQNAAAEWIQAHWRRIQDITDKKYKVARKKAKNAWKKKNKKM
jgi:hypothetical protein